MKKFIRGLFFVVILISMSCGVFAESSLHCLSAEPKIKLDINVNPPATCFNVIPYFDCTMDDKSYIVIQNMNCTEKLFYIFGDGQVQEVDKNPYDLRDVEIPQEIGTEWTRQLYFEDSPNNTIVINGKNLEAVSSNNSQNNDGKNYLVYYVIGGLIILLFLVYFIFMRRK